MYAKAFNLQRDSSRQASLAIGLITAVTGAMVLVGWALHIPTFTSVLPNLATMKPNTALGIFLCGVALALKSRPKLAPPARVVGITLVAVAIAIGVLTLSEYLCGWNLGIDRWLFHDLMNSAESARLGRMSPSTAFCLLLVGTALVMAYQPVELRARRPVVTALGFAVSIIGALALSGYVSSLLLHARWWDYSGMALHTAAVFVLLGYGLLAMVSSEGALSWSVDPLTTGGFAVGICSLVVVAGVSQHVTNQLQQDSAWVSHTQEVLKEIQEISTGVSSLLSTDRGYVISGEERFLARREQTKAAILDDLRAVRALTSDNPRQQRRLAVLAPSIDQRLLWDEKTIAARRQQGFATAERMTVSGPGIGLSVKIQGLFQQLEDEEYGLLRIRQQRSAASSTITFLLLPLGVFVSLTILSLGLFFLNMSAGERALGEESLRESQARLGGIVDSAMDAIVSIDDELKVVLFNAAAEQMFHCPAAQALGRGVDTLVPQRFREEYLQSIRDFGESGFTSRTLNAAATLSGLRGNGEEFPIESSISQTTVSGQKLFTIILRDISERKQAERSVVELAAIVASSDDAIIGKDLNSIVTSWNAGAENIFGYSASEMVGHSITRLIPPDRKGEEAQILNAIKRGESIHHYETVRLTKDGLLIDVSVAISPIKDSSGTVVGASKVARDITEHKRAEESLRVKDEEVRTMTQQLWQTAKLATMGELAASVAHELNNPLFTVALRIESLLGQMGPDNPGRRSAEIIEQEVKRMSELVAQLLQFSRRNQSQISTVNMRDEIEKSLELVHFYLRNRKIEVVLDIAPDLLTVQADRQQLRQVFLNLINNAADAMPEGGKLTIGCYNQDGRVVVEIRDTGTGIPEENLAKLMEAFFTTKPEGKGTGLGLAICRRAVQEHRGTFEVFNGTGAGAIARVSLPATNDARQ